jgi:hypothetical protein
MLTHAMMYTVRRFYLKFGLGAFVALLNRLESDIGNRGGRYP